MSVSVLLVAQTATGSRAAEGGDVTEPVMIAVDSSDLRREPQRFERQRVSVTVHGTAAAAAEVDLLAMNAADVTRQRITSPSPPYRDPDLQDASSDLDRELGGARDLGHVAEVGRNGKEMAKSSTGPVDFHRPYQRSRQRHGDLDLEDASCDLDSDLESHVINFERDGEEIIRLPDCPDDDDDVSLILTSRVAGDGSAAVSAVDDDNNNNDINRRRCSEAHVHLSQLATASQVAKETESSLRQLMWRLSMKQLRRNDWTKLAKHWSFTDEHVRAIRCQYTGLFLSLCLTLRRP